MSMGSKNFNNPNPSFFFNLINFMRILELSYKYKKGLGRKLFAVISIKYGGHTVIDQNWYFIDIRLFHFNSTQEVIFFTSRNTDGNTGFI